MDPDTSAHEDRGDSGTNDIDTKDPEVILDEYIEIVDLLRAKYPGIQINELPPRKVNHDDKTQSMNVLLRELRRVNDFIHIRGHTLITYA